MKRFALIVVVASCGKGATPSGGSAASVVTADPFAGATGVVITSKDVIVDGKSLGTLPSSLVADRTPLVDALAKRTGSAAALAYTDDASAEAVIAALRGFGELAQRNAPPAPADSGSADESGGTGTAMALDEGKMGAKDTAQYKMTRNHAEGGSNGGDGISISAVVGGKPTEICRVIALPAPAADDEQVELALQIHHDKWIRALSRVNEVATLEPHAQDLERELTAQKASAFFSDRDDIELAAAPDVTGADLTPVIATQCKVGFRSLRALTMAEATAQVASRTQTTYSLGQPDIVGELDKVSIRRSIKRNVKQIAACYEHELATKPTLAGVVTARFTIAPDGKVTASSASGVDPAVASCVADAIKQTEFSKPTSGKADVTYPITFHPLVASP